MAYRREKAGIFVADWNNFDAARAQLAFRSGFRFLICHGHAGASAPEPYGHVPPELLGAWRKAGLVVGCFGTFGEDDDPLACAWAANGIIFARDFAFYVANIEPAFLDVIFLREFRRLQPTIPMWLSSMLDDPRDWKAWFRPTAYKAADVWMPECYMNEDLRRTPEEAEFKGVNQHGIPRDRIKPTFGFGWAKPIRVATYVTVFRQSGLPPGFTVWREGTTDAQLQEWGRGIQAFGIALT